MPAKCAPGKHVWKFGKCSKCGKREGKLLTAGQTVNPGGSVCPKSIGGRGKHKYKFGVCTLCKQSEHGGKIAANPRPDKVKPVEKGGCPPHKYQFGKCRKCGKPEGRLADAGSFADPGGVACPKSIGGKGKHKYKFGVCTMCKKSEHGGKIAANPRPDKVKPVEQTPCPPHKYQFGKCRKCGKKEGRLADAGSFADPGGVACPKSIGGKGKHKYKFGVCTMCKKSEHGGKIAANPRPDKVKPVEQTPCPPHKYQFGKCRKCGKPEGRLADAGSFADPGGVACPKSIGGKGKHKYKFGVCTMCKKSEHGGKIASNPRPDKVKPVSKKPCPPHTYQFGKCRKCGKPEAKLAKMAKAKPGAGCPKSKGGIGKHAFQFGKCKACGKREF